jgi:hypothetical protein
MSKSLRQNILYEIVLVTQGKFHSDSIEIHYGKKLYC